MTDTEFGACSRTGQSFSDPSCSMYSINMTEEGAESTQCFNLTFLHCKSFLIHSLEVVLFAPRIVKKLYICIENFLFFTLIMCILSVTLQ